MTDSFTKAYLAALAMMEQNGAPDDIHETAAFAGRRDSVVANDALLRSRLEQGETNDVLHTRLHLALSQWDRVADAPWTNGTAAHSPERRDLIIRLLGVDELTAKIFTDRLPYPDDHGDTVIATRANWFPWYTDEHKQQHAFYWKHYRELLERKGWGAASIDALDAATDEIIGRLADPSSSGAYQSKGLVVGYVQSGKTANFTGVVAKAVDAGYRLIIVLTGMTNLLRRQTQRRLDMELVGFENILRGVDPHDQEALDAVDYQDDEDWLAERFLRHDVRFEDSDLPAIHRLTTYEGDYRSLRQGIESLNFPKADKKLPFYAPTNLFPADAKVAVVKKNSTVLSKLVRDLHRITAKLTEIPVLIIDDESDQASVNTSNPKKWQNDRERTAINRHLSTLLRELPRAQYVGYTATPFANVFVDPSDAEDIFPKDFLIALRRPPGYMGAIDFHDLDAELEEGERSFANSREKAHVRFVDDADDDRLLLRAIDTFVLTGAMKLYREAAGAPAFRHHTMLFHEAMRTAQHREQTDRVRRLWKQAGYYSAASRDRLRKLFDEDIHSVSMARGGEDSVPESFDELLPHISDAVARIGQPDPVIVVNSDQDIVTEDADFEQRSIWRIIVGGNNLSRGFTIEGLTVSFFTRRSAAADTMMQMGRWFGFRPHYRDLVRLYISPKLYEGFEAVVRDEEFFRAELQRYSTLVDGRPQVTPEDVLPLVSQHAPWLRPTAANKMYNAEMDERRSPGIGIEHTGYPEGAADRRANVHAFSPLLAAADQKVVLHGAGAVRYPAYVGTVSHSVLLDTLSQLRWVDDEGFEPNLRWLRRLGPEKIEDWAVLFPQQNNPNETCTLLGHGPFSVFRRKRRTETSPYFAVVSEPRHRHAAERIVGMNSSSDDPEAVSLAAPRRGAITVYPLVEKDAPAVSGPDPERIVLGFRLLAPPDATVRLDGRLVTFKAKNARNRETAIRGVVHP
ncbi:Z1 domain-containing protein [Actinomadura algeriensis]|uniref:Putative endonuclease Z1 domain-containing protein n=1 Tax=Actinomadura algeriensis TaxID=1679523 RepID=A0ABR9JRQ0_9ACTN|nr:Z1 domain-containing protein [Actinomadura algeriensis]MBE1533207.1 hypothetical protein [Actinomadura algeriensis]